jgi:hypothetical protein
MPILGELNQSKKPAVAMPRSGKKVLFLPRKP